MLSRLDASMHRPVFSSNLVSRFYFGIFMFSLAVLSRRRVLISGRSNDGIKVENR